MDRFRDSVDAMSRAQRATLVSLALLVLVVGVAAVLVAVERPGPDDATAQSSTAVSTTTSAPGSTSTALASSTSSSSSTTTSTSTSTTALSTTTTVAPERVLVLRPDGLGESYFGDDAASVVQTLSEILGGPDGDTGWVDQRKKYGTCLGETVRFVQWSSLRVFLTDGPSEWAPAGVRHLASYTQAAALADHPLDLVTADGLALGSPVGDIRALYGDDAVFDDPAFGPLFVYDPPGFAYQWGEVTGIRPEDTILSIVGGFACGE